MMWIQFDNDANFRTVGEPQIMSQLLDDRSWTWNKSERYGKYRNQKHQSHYAESHPATHIFGERSQSPGGRE
ncbi:hypothetical protein Pla52n_48000 [Stieleria varia]|uniref:Uncharacterized protein n=1 Tax=Stieleria varia TaxID=2528005 RepID=A0A5C6AFA2_9BACT|nr:hypothetical protein Pla52n_48000 [Stieleria varia]